MSGPNGERCGFCYYCSDPEAVEAGRGWCKRYPQPHDTEETRKKDWWWSPLVSVSSWCGEFKLHPKMDRLLWAALIRNGVGHYDYEVKDGEIQT